MTVSVVSPVYHGEKIINQLVERLENSFKILKIEFEIILVDDCSPDLSWKVIKKLCEKKKYIKGIKLSRNFGQHYAIMAGMKLAKGEWVVVMDCDLQDQPEEIINLFEKTKDGYDIVFAKRVERYDSIFKKVTSKLFYKVFGYLTSTKQDSTIANFGIYNKKVINAVLSMGDYIRYFPTMVQWVGFKSTKIEVKHSPRIIGTSSYTLKKLLNLAIDNIIAFSDKPLRLLIKFGLCLAILSFLIGLIYLLYY